MPYVAPATVVTATTIASAWGNSVKAAADYLANPPACRVRHSAGQSIPHNTLTTLAFNTEDFDTNAMHDTVTNNSRITINTAGLYLVTFCCVFDPATDYKINTANLDKNAATIIAVGSGAAGTDGGVGPRVVASYTAKFVVGDYLQVKVFQTNAAAVARNVVSAAEYSPVFTATWIGTG